MDDHHEGLLTRRRLLETGAVAVATVTLLDSTAFAAAQRLETSAKSTAPAAHFTRKGYRRSRFEPHVGTTVKLRPHGGAAVRMQLAAVEDVPNVKGLAGAPDAYVLRFRGPLSQPLAEGIVGVRHRQFGTLQLYVSPVAPDGATQDYLAAINRRIPRRERAAARRH
ncbi:MAG: hypothetical protein QOJ89_3281 [bacterium]